MQASRLSEWLRGWRFWPQRLGAQWRGSLQFRTVAITVALSGLAVSLIGAYMSASIGDNLFESRLGQVLGESARAAGLAQEAIDAELTATDPTRADLDNLSLTVVNNLRTSSTSIGGLGAALLRTPGQQTTVTMQPALSRSFPEAAVSDELRATVTEGRIAERVWWQSVTLGDAEPGIVVGSLLTVPGAGYYELYLAFDLSDAQSTLNFVHTTLGFGGLALVALIGAVTFVVVRLVIRPVQEAAEVSQQLAAGQLEQRIPERGEDVLATLARSFNGMADSLQRQITKLGELSRLQQRFVSDVSHELRTPLTTIRLAGDVLYDRRDSFDAATARSAELLHAQIQRFEHLLADLLEVSRYDAGAIELELEPVSLVRLAEDAVEAMRLVAAERGSDIRLIAAGGYLEAELDQRRIRRILRNLLGNAIEHGEGKPIIVTVDSNEFAVALTVRDYGIGIEPQHLEQVFDRFWRADPSRQRTIGGTGLGLAISTEDAALHNGRLEVWSKAGEGACFRLTLPRVHGDPLGVSPLELPPDDPVDELLPEPLGAMSDAPPAPAEAPPGPDPASTRPLELPRGGDAAEGGEAS